MERVAVLSSTVPVGGAILVWLGQPPGLPTPSALTLTRGGRTQTLAIEWVVPGLARLALPTGLAPGPLSLETPARYQYAQPEQHALTITASPLPPAPQPPAQPRLVTATRTLRYGSARSIVAEVGAVRGAVAIVARWGGFGSHAEVAAGATSGALISEERCGTRPPFADLPARGARVELALADAAGQVSPFVGVTMP